MSVENLEKRSGETTRQRILEAALTRFAQSSYEDVKLRDIAVDVGVDVALVHRCFGSKERLFAKVFETAMQIERLLPIDETDLSGVFLKAIFEPEPDQQHRSATNIFVQSLSSLQARAVLRNFAIKDFIAPLAARLHDRAPQRAALMTACLVGIAVLRDVLQIEALQDEARDDSQPLIEKMFRACLEEDLQTSVG